MGFRFIQLCKLLYFFISRQQLQWQILILTYPLLAGVIPSILHVPYPHKVVLLGIKANLGHWYLSLTFVLYELLKLIDAIVFELNALLSLAVDPVEGTKLLFQLDDCLVTLIKP